MKLLYNPRLVMSSIIVFFYSCSSLNHNEELIGGYFLKSFEYDHDMSIVYNIDEGVSVNVIPATVFAISYTDDYIIAKQHPFNNTKNEGWKEQTNYFIIPINKPISKSKDLNFIGPLTEKVYLLKISEMGISETVSFTTVVED